MRKILTKKKITNKLIKSKGITKYKKMRNI